MPTVDEIRARLINKQLNDERMNQKYGPAGANAGILADTTDPLIKEANELAYRHGLNKGAAFFYKFLKLEQRVAELDRANTKAPHLQQMEVRYRSKPMKEKAIKIL